MSSLPLTSSIAYPMIGIMSIPLTCSITLYIVSYDWQSSLGIPLACSVDCYDYAYINSRSAVVGGLALPRIRINMNPLLYISGWLSGK